MRTIKLIDLIQNEGEEVNYMARFEGANHTAAIDINQSVILEEVTIEGEKTHTIVLRPIGFEEQKTTDSKVQKLHIVE